MNSSVVLLANGRAGSAAQARIETVTSTLEELGAQVEVARTRDLDDVADTVAGLDGRRLIVAGGDGSVHAVVNALADDVLAGAPVGIVPMGTGNDLARTLGLPDDPADAARVALRGTARTLDLVAVTGSGGRAVMVNAGHAGLGAAAAERADGFKAVVGPAAYPLGALLAGVAEEGWELLVDLDGRRVHRGTALMVGVANARTIGGGTPLAPDADPGDGRLDVVVVTAVERGARLGFANALREGTHPRRDDVAVHRGVEVRISGQPVAHDIDGELWAPQDEVTYRVRPGAWSVPVPHAAPDPPGA